MKTQSDPPTESTQEQQEKKKWVEPVAALLMALATLSTAWCSYQSAAWTRQTNRLMNEFNALERKAGLLSLQGTQQATIQVTMFMQMLAAQQAGNEKLANFYVERFPPNVRKAYDAWLSERPFENPNADPHPFVPNYTKCRERARPPKPTPMLQAVCREPVAPATFPVNTSRTPFCLPQCFSSSVPRGSLSRAGYACSRLVLQWQCLRLQ